MRTEREVEGRDTEIWTLADDAPLQVVGRPAPRIDSRERARGEAVYTADVVLAGMLEAAILTSPHTCARVRRIDLAARPRRAGRAREARAGRLGRPPP